MGLLGMAIGLATEIVGIVTDDEKLVKKGLKRVGIGAATTLAGDFFGFSDSIEILSSAGDVIDS